MAIMAFDDDKEELIEYMDTTYFYFFTFVLLYFFYKHSVHYFSFLEASATDSRSTMFIETQFKGDFLALFFNDFKVLLTIIKIKRLRYSR
jgi:hypothetical protein